MMMATPGSSEDGKGADGEGKTKLNGAPFPPRPKAIATFLSSEDFLDGCQTLLYSLKNHLAPTPKDQYPPEIIVLLSSKLAESNSNAAAVMKKFLCPIFCDRIIMVEHIPIANNNDPNGSESKPSHVQSWDENCGWTKLRLFELDSYDTILYIDADCLVVKDVGHLLHVDEPVVDSSEEVISTREKKVGLLAAAPDIFPPDKFNAGVMVIRPSKMVFREMMSCLPGADPKQKGSAKSCTSYDGGDTGFLNSFYPGWYTDMPAYSRLPFGYNAQRFMHHCTHKKQPKYWDEGIEDVRIIHYSSSPKPWDEKEAKSSDETKDEQSYLDENDATKIQQASNQGELERMWHTAFEKSSKYCKIEMRKMASKEKNASSQKRRVPPPPAPAQGRSRSSAPAARARPQNVHTLVQKRYKELRKSGMTSKEAMTGARAEYGLDKADEGMDPSKAVGQMFGLA